MKVFREHKFIVSMVNIVLGAAIGTCFTIWYLVFNFSSPLSHDSTINFVIALATVFGVAIHFDSVRKQRKDRLWEINKEHLLNFSKALADSIAIIESYIDRYLDHLEGVNSNEIDTKKAAAVHFKFREITSDFLNVYRPLLNNQLIRAIEVYRVEEKEIEKAYNNDDGIDECEAHEANCAAQKELQKELLLFIKKSSGV